MSDIFFNFIKNIIYIIIIIRINNNKIPITTNNHNNNAKYCCLSVALKAQLVCFLSQYLIHVGQLLFFSSSFSFMPISLSSLTLRNRGHFSWTSFTCDLRIRISADTLSCSSDSRFLSMAGKQSRLLIYDSNQLHIIV